MFRLPKSLDPVDGYFEVEPKNLFNPFVNKLWVTSGTTRYDTTFNWTVGQNWYLLKALYNKQNIQLAPHLFMRGNFNNSGANWLVNWFTCVVPEDKYWTLAFLFPTIRNRTNTIDILWLEPDGASNVGTLRTYWYYRVEAMSPAVNIRITPETIPTAEQTEQFLAAVNKIHDWYTNFLTPRIDQGYEDGYPFCENELPHNISHYMKNRRILYNISTDDNTFPSKVFREGFSTYSGDEAAAAAAFVCRGEFINYQGLRNYTMATFITDRSQLYNVFQYSQSPTEMLKWPRILKNEHKPVLYGVELEVSTNYDVRKIIDATNELFLIAKQDSSISGACRNRMELVTVPCSLRMHKREWAHFFSKLDYEQFDTSKDTNNGMHVHIDRTAFVDKDHIRNLAWLVNNPANVQFWMAVSERTEQSFNNFSPVASFGNRSKVSAFKQATDLVAGLRGAINVRSSKPTIEVRLFRGIVSYAAVLKNLECVDAMFNFTMSRNIKELNIRNFINWIRSTPPNKYQVFKKFIDTLTNLNKLMAVSDVKEVIFNAKDPEKIISILEKNKFKLTNDHITALNKGFKKRTFKLNKATGKLEIVFTNKSPLAHMDRELEKRFVSMAD